MGANQTEASTMTLNLVATCILQMLAAADGRRLRRGRLAQMLRDEGVPMNHYYAAALEQLEAAGLVHCKTRGRDRRGFRRRMVLLVRPRRGAKITSNEGLQP